jgi:hypothetical protein
MKQSVAYPIPSGEAGCCCCCELIEGDASRLSNNCANHFLVD